MDEVAENLLRPAWTSLDSAELRLLLDERIGGLGQYVDRDREPNKLYLPLAGATSRLVLIFRDKKIAAIEPGEAFDRAEWKRIDEEIEESILAGTMKIGRDYSFSSFRVSGSWRGELSGFQILPPPEDAPRAPVEIAEHPFILEFPLRETGLWRITNHRRMRDHRRFTLLLNVLLIGRTSVQPRRDDHFWGYVPLTDGAHKTTWVQRSYFAQLGEALRDELSPPTAEHLGEIDPDERVGHDGKGLRVPTDLDDLICQYLQLSPPTREKFDRAAFWFDMASREWTVSVSSSFAALVSAIESLTERGRIHGFDCPDCGGPCQHEVPGATERFRAFLESYAGSPALQARRNEMYSLRSGILHGSELMQLDQDLEFGWDPPWWNERELHEQLWSLTRIALRNWLKQPSGT